MIELADIVRQHPDAAFIRRTQATSFEDRQGFRQAGYAMARDLLGGSGDGDSSVGVVKGSGGSWRLRQWHGRQRMAVKAQVSDDFRAASF